MILRLKIFLINNYRGILHITSMLEFLFIAWLFGISEVYDLVPSHTPVKIIFLLINFFVCQWTIKISGLEKLFEDERKKLSDLEK